MTGEAFKPMGNLWQPFQLEIETGKVEDVSFEGPGT